MCWLNISRSSFAHTEGWASRIPGKMALSGRKCAFRILNQHRWEITKHACGRSGNPDGCARGIDTKRFQKVTISQACEGEVFL